MVLEMGADDYQSEEDMSVTVSSTASSRYLHFPSPKAVRL